MIINKNSPIPQYFQLQTWIKEQIEQGDFKENDKILTEEEFAKITGLAWLMRDIWFVKEDWELLF